jgi:hypothetical protein
MNMLITIDDLQGSILLAIEKQTRHLIANVARETETRNPFSLDWPVQVQSRLKNPKLLPSLRCHRAQAADEGLVAEPVSLISLRSLTGKHWPHCWLLAYNSDTEYFGSGVQQARRMKIRLWLGFDWEYGCYCGNFSHGVLKM